MLGAALIASPHLISKGICACACKKQEQVFELAKIYAQSVKQSAILVPNQFNLDNNDDK